MAAETPVDHEVRISRVEAEVGSLARSVGDLVNAMASSEERSERQHADTQKAIRAIADQRGVSLSQILIGMASFVAAVGTFVGISGAIIAGVLYLASNQSKDASRLAVDRVEPRIAHIETALGQLSGQTEHNTERINRDLLARFAENEDDIERVEAKTEDRFPGERGQALEQRVSRLEALEEAGDE